MASQTQRKQNLKRGAVVAFWKNYVAEGAVFLRWVDCRMAEIVLGDGTKLVVNGSAFDVA